MKKLDKKALRFEEKQRKNYFLKMRNKYLVMWHKYYHFVILDNIFSTNYWCKCEKKENWYLAKNKYDINLLLLFIIFFFLIKTRHLLLLMELFNERCSTLQSASWCFFFVVVLDYSSKNNSILFSQG
jgi:hypothetical protein